MFKNSNIHWTPEEDNLLIILYEIQLIKYAKNNVCKMFKEYDNQIYTNHIWQYPFFIEWVYLCKH